MSDGLLEDGLTHPRREPKREELVQAIAWAKADVSGAHLPCQHKPDYQHRSAKSSSRRLLGRRLT